MINDRDPYRIVALALSLLALPTLFTDNMQCVFIGTALVAFSIYFRFLAAGISKLSTGVENEPVDKVVATSATYSFLVAVISRRYVAWAMELSACSSLDCFDEVFWAGIIILFFVIYIGIRINRWEDNKLKDAEEVLRNSPAGAETGSLQRLKRSIIASVTIPITLALLPELIRLPLNLILTIPRFLEHSELMKRKERLRLLFIVSSKIDVERRLWRALRQVAAKGRGLASVFLPVYLIAPSLFYGFLKVNMLMSAPATLKVSYLLLLMPGLASLFLVNTRFFSTGAQRVKLMALTLAPFYVLLALSATYPSEFLLQIPGAGVRLSFLVLVGIVTYFTTYGVLKALTILAEESGRSPARWLTIMNKYFLIFYSVIYITFGILYLGLVRTLGVLGSIEVVGYSTLIVALINVIINLMFREENKYDANIIR